VINKKEGREILKKTKREKGEKVLTEPYHLVRREGLGGVEDDFPNFIAPRLWRGNVHFSKI